MGQQHWLLPPLSRRSPGGTSGSVTRCTEPPCPGARCSSRVVGHLAGGRVAAESFPGTEAEEGAHPVAEHHEAGEELEEEHSDV